MTEQMSLWLSNPTKGVAFNSSTSPATLQISRIFLWFQGDFTSTTPAAGGGGGGGGSNEVDFIRKYRNDIPETPPTVAYFDYNWSINEFTED
jgi:hypothetical protein